MITSFNRVSHAEGKVSRHLQFIDEIAARGGVTFVARSVKEVKENLLLHDRD